MSFTVAQVLEWVRGRLVNADASEDRFAHVRIGVVSALAQATGDQIAFFFSKEFQAELIAARPGILVTGEAFVLPLQTSGLPIWKTSAIISCADPYLGMALISEKLAQKIPELNTGSSDIHPSAVVHSSAKLGRGVKIGAHVVIEARAEVGDRSVIYPGTFVGAGVKFGEDCLLYSNVSIYEGTTLGNRVRIHAGTVIGADGFGYAPIKNSEGLVINHQKIFHQGGVQIGDDVEIGANSCVDRGTFGNTVIGPKSKLDNLVQVGHNCQIGEGSIVCGNVGLAGSAQVGNFVYIGGGAGVGNRVELGDRAMIGGYAMVDRDVEAGHQVTGNPQRDIRTHFKVQAIINKMVADREKKRKK